MIRDTQIAPPDATPRPTKKPDNRPCRRADLNMMKKSGLGVIIASVSIKQNPSNVSSISKPS